MINNWLNILRTAVNNSSQGQIAGLLGYSRATVSLVLSGKYPGDTKHIQHKVMATLATVQCPYLSREIEASECLAIANGKAPTHNPAKMAHWRACLKCKNTCKKGDI